MEENIVHCRTSLLLLTYIHASSLHHRRLSLPWGHIYETFSAAFSFKSCVFHCLNVFPFLPPTRLITVLSDHSCPKRARKNN